MKLSKLLPALLCLATISVNSCSCRAPAVEGNRQDSKSVQADWNYVILRGEEVTVNSHNRGKVTVSEVYSIARWVPAWNGFAAILTNGDVVSIAADGAVSPRGKLIVMARTGEWTVSSDGALLAAIDPPGPGVTVYNLRTGERKAALSASDLVSRKVDCTAVESTLQGVAFLHGQDAVAFSVPVEEPEDTGGIGSDSTVIWNFATNEVRLLNGVAPIDGMADGSLLSWTDRGSSDYNTVKVFDRDGLEVGARSSVRGASVVDQSVVLLVEVSNSVLEMQVWTATLSRMNSKMEIKDFLPSDQSGYVKFGPSGLRT